MSKISAVVGSKNHYGGVTLAERMRECHAPAVSIALIENSEISEVYTRGVKRREKMEDVTADTLFQAASISKPVFAVAVMRLAEKEALDIDADISEYLVDYEVPAFDNKKHKITLRQILSHHAGLNIHGFYGYQHGQKIPTVEQILTGATPSNSLKLKLIHAPGTKWKYSGGGYVLAQKAVMDICKLDFCDLMSNLVLLSFRMTRSTFSQPLQKDKIGDIAFGYDSYNLQLPEGFNTYPELSAAGLWSTPSDLARFGIGIMKTLNGESTVVGEKTAEILTTKAYENSPYGIGFAVDQCKKGMTFGHNGSNVGYRSIMRFCPDDGSGFVVMQNSDIGEIVCVEIDSAFVEVLGW